MKLDIINQRLVDALEIKEMIDIKHEEDLQRLRGFRLLDDDFMTKFFDGNTECIE